MVTKLKNSNCDKSQKLKLRQNSKIQIFTKLNMWHNLNCDKTQIVTQLKNSKYDKTQIMTKLKNWNC